MNKIKIAETVKGRLLIIDGVPPSDSGWILPEGKWELLNILPSITEEQAKEVVLDLWIGGFGERYFHHNSKNSLGNYVHFKTAKEALISLVESEVPLKNRFGEYPPKEGSEGRVYGMGYRYMMDEWMDEDGTIFKNPALYWEPQKKKP